MRAPVRKETPQERYDGGGGLERPAIEGAGGGPREAMLGEGGGGPREAMLGDGGGGPRDPLRAVMLGTGGGPRTPLTEERREAAENSGDRPPMLDVTGTEPRGSRGPLGGAPRAPVDEVGGGPPRDCALGRGIDRGAELLSDCGPPRRLPLVRTCVWYKHRAKDESDGEASCETREHEETIAPSSWISYP